MHSVTNNHVDFWQLRLIFLKLLFLIKNFIFVQKYQNSAYTVPKLAEISGQILSQNVYIDSS